MGASVLPGALRLGVSSTWRSTRPNQAKVSTNTPEWRALRQKVMDRDDYRCQYCGFRARFYQIAHHLNGVPDDHRLENLTTICQACNAIVHCGLAAAKGYLELVTCDVSQETIVQVYRNRARERMYGLQDSGSAVMLEIAGLKYVFPTGNNYAFVGNEPTDNSFAVTTYANTLLATDNVPPNWAKDLKAVFTPKFDKWQLEYEA